MDYTVEILSISSLDKAAGQLLHTSVWGDRPYVSPQDIAEGAAFLCSGAGRFISGCGLPYLFF